jgi:hypothetical protein
MNTPESQPKFNSPLRGAKQCSSEAFSAQTATRVLTERISDWLNRSSISSGFVKENLKPLKRLDNMRAEKSPIYQASGTINALKIDWN